VIGLSNYWIFNALKLALRLTVLKGELFKIKARYFVMLNVNNPFAFSASKMDKVTSKVNILLSTYNGARFLQEQLDSLLNQDYPNISIHIRDDGSTDNTIALIQEYQAKYPNVHLDIAKNVGYIRSFYELVYSCEGNDSELYAFCDQDDVWNAQKISRGVNSILKSTNPLMTLYFSRMELVDSCLNPIGLSQIPRSFNFVSGLIGTNAYGCAAIFSYGIRELFLQGKPADMLSHDWWVYLVASAFGCIIYDREPQVKYRQHGSNTNSGYRSELLTRLKFRTKELLQRLFQNRPIVDFVGQAEKFLKIYHNLPLEHRLVIEEARQNIVPA